MTLYELRGYRTDHYDRTSDRRIRLKDFGFKPSRIEDWIARFFGEFPDGKVIISIVERTRYGRKVTKIRKVEERKAR